MRIDQRPAERPSLQGAMVFRGSSAEDVAAQLTVYLNIHSVKVTAMSALLDPLPKPKDGSVALIVTLQED